MLSAEALREEGTVCEEQRRKKKKPLCLFSMSFKELSHQRREAALFLRSPLAPCQFTRSHMHPLSHTLKTHI